MKSPHFCWLLLLFVHQASAHPDSEIQYLGNEGVAVFHDGTTILFDPLFRLADSYYTAVPDSMRESLFTASTPFERIDAVFVSHYHLDHFDPSDMLRLLEKHSSMNLFGPKQAIDRLREVSETIEPEIIDRITAIDLEYGDSPVLMQSGKLRIEAYFVPHSGWPTRRLDVQNIAFRVTLDDTASIVHLGDADPNLIHFERHRESWKRQGGAVALPPYWFFDSRDGNSILEQFIQPTHSIGIHVPTSYRDENKLPDDLRNYDLFTIPGETRPWILPAN